MSMKRMKQRILAITLALAMAVAPVTEVRAATKIRVKEVSGEYDYGTDDRFSEGMIRVSRDHKIGYLNTEGEEVIACQYEAGYRFTEGMACVEKGGKYGAVNKKGEEIVNC